MSVLLDYRSEVILSGKSYELREVNAFSKPWRYYYNPTLDKIVYTKTLLSQNIGCSQSHITTLLKDMANDNVYHVPDEEKVKIQLPTVRGTTRSEPLSELTSVAILIYIVLNRRCISALIPFVEEMEEALRSLGQDVPIVESNDQGELLTTSEEDLWADESPEDSKSVTQEKKLPLIDKYWKGIYTTQDAVNDFLPVLEKSVADDIINSRPQTHQSDINIDMEVLCNEIVRKVVEKLEKNKTVSNVLDYCEEGKGKPVQLQLPLTESFFATNKVQCYQASNGLYALWISSPDGNRKLTKTIYVENKDDLKFAYKLLNRAISDFEVLGEIKSNMYSSKGEVK